MRGDFLVGEAFQGLAQIALGVIEIAQAEVHPAEAVENRRVFRAQLMGFFDQGLGFGVAGRAIGQGITQGVECHGVVRVALDDLSQVFFHLRQVIAFFCLHGPGVQQVQVIRVLLQGFVEDGPGTVFVFIGGQGFDFDQVQLDRIVRFFIALFRQAGLGFGGTPVVHQDVGLAQLGRQVIGTRGNLAIFDQGTLGVVALFGDTPQIQVRGVDVAVPGNQVFQVTLGFFPGLGFQANEG
ncbi:hypothetical protein D3C78_1124110 [compost metagenome]